MPVAISACEKHAENQPAQGRRFPHDGFSWVGKHWKAATQRCSQAVLEPLVHLLFQSIGQSGG